MPGAIYERSHLDPAQGLASNVELKSRPAERSIASAFDLDTFLLSGQNRTLPDPESKVMRLLVQMKIYQKISVQ